MNTPKAERYNDGEKPSYLELDPDIEKRILTDTVSMQKNPYYFADSKVLRREDKPQDAASLTRPAFIRDVEKIINVPAYNRYAIKPRSFHMFRMMIFERKGGVTKIECSGRVPVI